MYKKFCVICGREFTCRDRRTETCSNDCHRVLARRKYKTNTVNCRCDTCGKTYKATLKQSKQICPACLKARPHEYETYEQKIVCRRCGAVVQVCFKKKSRGKTKPILAIVTCDACKRLIAKSFSDRMKLNNPSYERALTPEEYKQKQETKERLKQDKAQRKEQNRKKASERMRVNNPMFNPETVKKVAKILKQKWENGEITIDRTKSKNYKGDRGTIRYLRIALKPWRVANLKRADYRCELCGKNHPFLHVHHKIPFRDIVEECQKCLNIKSLDKIEYKSEEYLQLEDMVLSFHFNNDIGLVVCPDCHDQVDSRYHKSKAQTGTIAVRRYNGEKGYGDKNE